MVQECTFFKTYNYIDLVFFEFLDIHKKLEIFTMWKSSVRRVFKPFF